MNAPVTDVVVVGAGIVGLAAAAALIRSGRSVLILEEAGGIGRGMTSRNSQVIHAGIYYPPGSFKARLCCAGRDALYARCEERKVAHRRLGKLIVATRESELEILEELRRRGTQNGAPGLEILDAAQARTLEPDLRVLGALFSPSTGVVDAHGLALSYLAEAQAGGADLLLRTRVEGLKGEAGGWTVTARTAEGEPESVQCAAVVNAAGLAADRIAELAGLDVDALAYRLHPCKGDYFSLAPGAPIRLSHLVYPVPESAGLGIHATLDLDGRVRFGPDAEYVSRPSYEVEPGKASSFAAGIRRYLPSLRAEWLSPDYAGVRAKLAGPGSVFRDFVVEEESGRGYPGLVSCIGIESPGLTAAPAIGARVVELLDAA